MFYHVFPDAIGIPRQLSHSSLHLQAAFSSGHPVQYWFLSYYARIPHCFWARQKMQLAEQLNISLNHVKALEHARRLFSIDLVIEISAFFDVSLDYLLLGKTQSTSKAASELNAAIEILERIKKEL